jgi:hypothetical protein
MAQNLSLLGSAPKLLLMSKVSLMPLKFNVSKDLSGSESVCAELLVTELPI